MAPGTPSADRSFPSPGRRVVLCGLLVLAALASGCEKEAPELGQGRVPSSLPPEDETDGADDAGV